MDDFGESREMGDDRVQGSSSVSLATDLSPQVKQFFNLVTSADWKD